MKFFFKYIYRILPFKQRVFSVIRHFNLPQSTFQHLYFKGVFKVNFDHYSFLIKHYGFQIENEVFWKGLYGGHEKNSMKIWVELCKSSKITLDVGANTGLFSLVSKAVNPKTPVYAFEPVTRVFDKLSENVKINNYDILCFDYALSNFDGKAKIYDTDSEHTYSVAVNKNLLEASEEFIETEINVKKLSTFIKEFNIQKIDLIKIDVETHEPEVLEGMGEYLIKFQPSLLIEILNDDVAQKIEDLIKGIDYLFFNIDEITKPKKVDKLSKSIHFNYLICKMDVAIKLNLI